MRRKHRHELKQNEFLVWLEYTVTWISENQRNLKIGAAVALAVGLILGGISYYQNSRGVEAQVLLNEAVDLFHARISDGTSAVQAAEGPQFASAGERYAESLAAFQKVIEQYSSLDQGRQARYYAAICQSGLGNYEDAATDLEELTGGQRDFLYYLASKALAAAKDEQGDHAGAIEIYRLMIEDPNNPLPKDQLLFSLAQTNERAGNLEEARNNYKRVLEEYPESVLRGEVLQRDELVEYRLEG